MGGWVKLGTVSLYAYTDAIDRPNDNTHSDIDEYPNSYRHIDSHANSNSYTYSYADTHGQSEPVFGLASLLGIKLMPRMRTWNDVTFYRVDRRTTYEHIDRLLTQVIDWDLIERYWQDMMQVVLSI